MRSPMITLILSLLLISESAFSISRIGNGKYDVKDDQFKAPEFTFEIPKGFKCVDEGGACSKLELPKVDPKAPAPFTKPFFRVLPSQNVYPELKSDDRNAMEKFFKNNSTDQVIFKKIQSTDCYDLYTTTSSDTYMSILVIENKPGVVIYTPISDLNKSALKDVLSTLKVNSCDKKAKAP